MSDALDERKRRYVAMLRHFGGSIVKYCYSHCNNESDAQDLSQDIMAILWESLDSLNPDSSPRQQNRWLYRVMRTAFFNHLLSRPRIMTVPLEYASEIKDEPVVDRELLDHYMTLLNDSDRRLVEERFNGYSNAEIAERLGLTENAVRQHFHRILKKLRKS